MTSTLGCRPEQAGERQHSVTPVMAGPGRVLVQATYLLEELPQALSDRMRRTRGKLTITAA
jgi:hypothetical protein